jgi:prevent-host-death family protein
MSDQIGIAQLRAEISRHVQAASRGQRVTILDRGRPVAQLVPYQQQPAIRIRTAQGTPREAEAILRKLPPLSKRHRAKVAAALEEIERLERKR